jgi:hypothetical protein
MRPREMLAGSIAAVYRAVDEQVYPDAQRTGPVANRRCDGVSRNVIEERGCTMATTATRRPRTDDERTQADAIHDAPPPTDWRRMTDVAHDNIARRAYELYEERGGEPGHDMDDWLRAEHDLEQRLSTD